MNWHRYVAMAWAGWMGTAAAGGAGTIALDGYHNNEQGAPGHYRWEGTDLGGYSELGALLREAGAQLRTIVEPLGAGNLEGVDILIMVDPDTAAETPDPKFIGDDEIDALDAWVRSGGRLVLFGNDQGNAEFERWNRLAARFSLKFLERTYKDATGKSKTFAMSARAPLGAALSAYLANTAPLEVSHPEPEILLRDGATTLMVKVAHGAGAVVALGDPWIYNEYIDAGDNRRMAANLFGALLDPASMPRKVTQLYAEFCANCHGGQLEGGQGTSLMAEQLQHGSDDDSLARSIADGFPDKGMPAWEATLSAAEIRSLVVYLQEKRSGQGAAGPPPLTTPTGVLSSELHRFRVETVADGLQTPWSIAFLPEGRMLVTERPGRLRMVEHGKLLPEPIAGIPETRDFGQGGLLAVAAHPDFARNGWIYLSYSDIQQNREGREVSLTKIVRGRIRNARWADQQTIWQGAPEHYLPGPHHFGGRMAFREGYLYFTHGERFMKEQAQDLARPNGKVHRLHDDGRIPADNPFVDRADAYRSIFSYGHRNPQGLAFEPGTDRLWESEHGPRGGDEINLIHAGRNYGWPVITYGMDYDGTPISGRTAQEGMEQPVLHWTPSIAVSAIAFGTSKAFPKWRGNLFAAALAQQELRRLVLDGENITHQEVVLKGIGRLRDIAFGPDGYLYIALNGPDKVVRLVPEKGRADVEAGKWLTGGRDYQQSYYSPLTAINKANVGRLGLAWSYDIGVRGAFQATPIVVDGVMFTSGPRGAVYALDARTGVPQWTFAPGIDPADLHACSGRVVNRGVAVWRGNVYVGSTDGYLYALNARSGEVIWKVDTIADRARGYSSTGAPYVANEHIVIGNAGAECDARGYVTAYDSRTGKQAWRFFTVPGDPRKGFEHPELEMAAKTWDPHSLWEVGLGGTVWDGMAYDPESNLLYVGTGNGTPWPRALRSPAGGDNLFLSSILALNADTGRLAWHYQTTPGDNWDYTATQKIILAELTLARRARQVLLQAPKNGFFYVLDRATGELLSAAPYATVTWASGIDLKTGRPQETAQGDYSREPKLIFPGTSGAHSWHPMAFNPSTGLVYIPVQDVPTALTMPEEPFEYRKSKSNLGASIISLKEDSARVAALTAGQPDHRRRYYIKAWDPAEQRLAWQVETPSLNGVMTTAGGLVFQGRRDGHFVAMDAATGVQLHSLDIGQNMAAAPSTYAIEGQQYVAVMADVGIQRDGIAVGETGGKSRILVFKLDGGTVPKHTVRVETGAEISREPPIPRFGAPEQLALGRKLLGQHCLVCHANADQAPDLTRMNAQAHREFMAIVMEGRRLDRGMGNFSAVLSESDARAIHAYVTELAWGSYRDEEGERARE